nr:alpha/beta family hydrolase [Catenulispora pinistramenti]
MLGHGTATGVEAADLQAIAAALPPRGISVALVTQPYRLNRARSGSDEPSLDTAWRAVRPSAAELGVPIISGGRSAGSQVACRTAEELGAHAVLALAYPLLGPGSPRELLATGRPTLIRFGTDWPAAPEPTVVRNIADLTAFDGFTADELRGVERDNALTLFPRFA